MRLADIMLGTVRSGRACRGEAGHTLYCPCGECNLRLIEVARMAPR
jgi:hypothetical protein